MTKCQHCHATSDLYLCTSCQTQLGNMLHQIPWLLEELDNRIAHFDKITVGTIGRNRTASAGLIVDIDAIEISRKTRKTLLYWVETIVTKATGKPPTSLHTVTTPNLAKWLAANTNHIARLDLAHKNRHPLYDDIKRITGTPQQPGQLHHAINPVENHYAGPCPTPTGRDHNGTPRRCGTNLFADTYDKTTTCPTCHQTINVENNRRQAAAERDLHTRTELLDVLTNIDEPINPTQLGQWITARRLRPAGYRHNDTITQHRTQPGDEPVYSLDRTRRLRRKDIRLKTRA